MRKTYIYVILLLLFMFNFGYAAESKKIGILQDGSYWWNDAMLVNIRAELSKLTAGEFELVFEKQNLLNGNYDISLIKQHAQALAQKGRVDAILAIGPASAVVLTRIKPLPVPVLAVGTDEPVSLGVITPKTFLPLNPNLTTIYDPTIEISAITFMDRLLTFKKMTYLCASFMCANFPVFEEKVYDAAKIFTLSEGQAIIGEAVSISPDNYAGQIAKLDTDAVVIGRLYGFTKEQTKDIYDRLSQRKFPSITIEGKYGADQGALFAVGDYDFKYLGRKIALKMASILRGTPPSELSIVDNWKLELVYNQETARKIDYDIPLEFLYDAKIVGAPEPKMKLTLAKVHKLALETSLDIAIKVQEHKQSKAQAGIARGGYLPRVESNVGYTRIDNRRADLQPSPREQSKFEMTLLQNLYNRELSKQIEVAELETKATQQDRELTEQDVLLELAIVYTNLLMAEDVVLVRQKQLTILRKHMDIAQLRYELEETGKSDVLRLEMQYNQGRVELIKANQDLNKARAALVNLLNLPDEISFAIMDKNDFSEEEFALRFADLDKYFYTERRLKVFRDFLIAQAYKNSAELRLINTRLEQARVDKQRVYGKFWPTLNAGASCFQQIHSQHRELGRQELPLASGDTLLLVDEKDVYDKSNETGWSAHVTLTFPFYTGGTRFKELGLTNAKIMEIEARKKQLKADLAQNARLAYFDYHATRSNTKIAVLDVKLARENLKLAEAAYLQGSLAIIDLLDIQNSLILAEVNATVLRYQYIRSVVKVFRSFSAVGLFYDPRGSAEDLVTLEYLNQYFKDNLPGFE